MSGEERVDVEINGATSKGIESGWMGRHLSGSIYMWACGEKAEDEVHGPVLSDRLIAWGILFLQGFAYTMLIVLAGPTSKSDTGSSIDDSEQSGYLLPSVIGAMYLLVASTTHDLHAGYSLLVDGNSACHQAFGLALLVVYGIMVAAAMTVLVSTSADSVSVVLNAVTVLFISDLDEKALKFLSAVPQKWRLFWAIESVGMGFALALIAIFYIADGSKLLEGSNGILMTFPTWFVCGINPTAVTLSSAVLSSRLQKICEWCSESRISVDEPTERGIFSRAVLAPLACFRRYIDVFKEEPFFYVTLGMWVAQSVSSWIYLKVLGRFPVAVTFSAVKSVSEQHKVHLTDNVVVLIYSNAVLVTGLALKAFRVLGPKQESAIPFSERSVSAGIYLPKAECGGSFAESRVPSLLVGWGIGYWVTSLLYVLGCSWHGGGCGWTPPFAVTLIAYVIIPCMGLAGVFMVADENVFGRRFRALVKPAVDTLQNRRGVEFWVMASVLRDIVVLWIVFCDSLRSPLDYYL